MYRGARVAVVIPAHNEARLLPVTLAGLPAFVDYVVVVDDGSSDATSCVARRRGRWTLDLIRHPRNQGVGGAIVTGYRRALALRADVAVVVGADAQMDPAEMPRLIDPVVDGEADYAKGDRLGHAALRARMPWVRRAGNHALTRLTRLSSGYARVRDSQCGYTAVARRALAALPLDDLYPRYGFPNDLLAKLSEIGARVVDRPVTPIYAGERSGIRIPKVVLPILWLLLRSGARRILRARAARRGAETLAPALADDAG